uniref:Reverse transcriptase domain-containing protein n=1 Tax=Tanacetum cinerariifolium TaxID=118510 RepID=A0A6L2J781_TANCI|nr:reverse transcriptase domain-containing protein [Tanacetum cinerariifolium]
MALTFADNHNMITFLTKSDASEGFDQIVDFLNAHVIQHALMVNPTIYVSCIKQFWTPVSIKKSNDVVRLQALLDRKKVIVTEDTIRQDFRLDDADSVDFLPNEEIFAELAWMGYEKPLVRNVDSPSKFLMYPRFLQLMINAQVGDLSSHNTKYTYPALTQKDVEDAAEDENDNNEVSAEPTPPSPTPALTPPPSPTQEHIPSPPQAQIAQPSSSPQQQSLQTAKISMNLLNTLLETCATLNKQVFDLEQDKIAQAIEITKLKQRVRRLEKKRQFKTSGLKRLRKDTDEAEPAKVEEVIEVVTAAKLMTEVVTTAATTITAAQVPKASALRKRGGVVIQDPKETTTALVIVHSKAKSKDKGKALKRKPKTEAQAKNNMMVYLKNMAGFKMDFFRGMTYTDIRPIFEKHYNSIQAFLDKGEEEITEQKKEVKEKMPVLTTPLALKVLVVDYQIYYENNKPFYKIIRADGTHKFQSLEPKNFSDDFLLNTLKTIFKKPNVEANIWREKKGIYGLAKVKSWKLFESCGVHIITFTTTKMFLLVEKKYHLTRFTLEQMLNNVRLKVEKESEMSLELLRLVRRQLEEGYIPELMMDDPNVTMEEYIKLQAKKAQRHFKADFLAIVYNDAFTSNKNVSPKPTVNIAPLPPKAQRHLWLRYQVKGYTEEIVHNFEERLDMIFDRHVNREHVLDFAGLMEEMRKALTDEILSVGIKTIPASDKECLTFKSKDEEYAMAVRDFKKFFNRRGRFLRQPKNDKKAFQRSRNDKNRKSSWSDSGEEDDGMVKDETCLVAQASSDVCSESFYFSDENSSIDDFTLDSEVDLEPDEWIKDSGFSKHMTGNQKLFSTYKAYNKGNVIFGSNLCGNIIDKGQICDNKYRVTFSENDSKITKDDKVIDRGIMFLNVDQLEKQLDKEEFQEIGSMAAFKVLKTQFQTFIKSRIYLDDEYVIMTRKYFLEYTQLEIREFHDTLIQHMKYVKKSIGKRALHKREYDSMVLERKMQKTKGKGATLDEADNDRGCSCEDDGDGGFGDAAVMHVGVPGGAAVIEFWSGENKNDELGNIEGLIVPYGNSQGGFRNKQRLERKQDRFTLLTKTPKEILALDKGKFKPPPPMTTPVEKRNASKFCEFHREVGHTTGECMHLKRQIEEMLKAEKLLHLIKKLKQNNGKHKKGNKKGETLEKDKSLAILMVQPWQRVAKQRITQTFYLESVISFPPLGEEDGMEGPMIIKAEMGGHFVHCMYMDRGSSLKILYEHCFNRFRLEIRSQTVPAATPLVKFSEEIIWPLRQLSLLVKIGEDEHSAFAWMNFMVVRTRSTTSCNRSSHRRKDLGSNSPRISKTNYSNRLYFNRRRGKELCSLLRRNLDIFAWKLADMTGVPRHIEEHKLNIHEGCLPVRQKKRRQTPERNEAIYEEVEKLVDAGIMKEVHYHSWLSNAVMVKKHDGSWRMCVDFKDLNNACPKDGYPLPEIDWKNLEVYMDDIVIKSRTEQEVIKDIKETFKTLREINMKLNPKKCTFGMREGMFLGYKVNDEGLKVCPNKIEAVCSLSSPKCLKDVNKLNGKLASLNRFLYKSVKKSLPLFKTLKKCTKKSDFVKRIKKLKAELPTLTAPKEKEELVIYLAAAKEVINAVLVTERDRRLLKWRFELEEHDIQYRPKTSVKGQIFVDFILERPKDDSPDTPMKDKEELSYLRILFIDGSSCVDGFRTGLIITNPEGIEFTYALRSKTLPTLLKNYLSNKYIGERTKSRHAKQDGIYQLHPPKQAGSSPRVKEPAAKLDPITSPWPFYKWGIDIAGPFLEGPGKVKFLIVAIDYLTKLIEAKPMATIAGAQTYGTEAVIPVEIDMPTLRTAEVDMIKNDEALEINLDLWKKEESKDNEASHEEDRGKLGPKWERPYDVTEALGKGVIKLRDRSGNILP